MTIKTQNNFEQTEKVASLGTTKPSSNSSLVTLIIPSKYYF